MGVGGLTLAGVGLSGYLQTRFFSHLGKVNSIIMLLEGSILVVIASCSIKNRAAQAKEQERSQDNQEQGKVRESLKIKYIRLGTWRYCVDYDHIQSYRLIYWESEEIYISAPVDSPNKLESQIQRLQSKGYKKAQPR